MHELIEKIFGTSPNLRKQYLFDDPLRLPVLLLTRIALVNPSSSVPVGLKLTLSTEFFNFAASNSD